MSDFSRFMRGNKSVKKNGFYPATKSLCDEKGSPLLWEFKHISSKLNEEIRDDCTIDVPVRGKSGSFRPKLKISDYIRKLIVASVVTPDLLNASLQDSYGVNSPDDLLLAMVDDPGEYDSLAAFIQEFQGFDVSFGDLVNEAKN